MRYENNYPAKQAKEKTLGGLDRQGIGYYEKMSLTING